MKHMMTALCLFALSFPAIAGTPMKHQALCEMELDVEGSTDNLQTIESLDIKEITALSATHLRLVNAHLQHQEYTDHDLNFAEVKALFSEGGEYAFDDLYVITFIAKSTGIVYTHVTSYPGDNPYGLIFTKADNKLVANNQDGSISLYTGNGDQTVWCGNLN